MYYFLSLSTERLKQKEQEMETRIAKTMDLLRYSQKYDSEKKKLSDSMAPELQINFLSIFPIFNFFYIAF